MTLALELFAAAFVSSIFGSMVGLGGGFVLVPILRLAFGLGPAEAAGTSLVLVTANSFAGATTYFLEKRVDVRLGMMFAAGGIPGAIVGAVITRHIAPRDFDWLFAVLLLAVAVDMIFNAKRRMGDRIEHAVGERKAMSFRLAASLGFCVGIVSSLFGIGGGVIVVPSLLYFSILPAHAISATSHFIILLTSPLGLVTHFAEHDVRIADIVPLALGGLLGAPIGARLSLRLKSPQLLGIVGVALICVAASLTLRHLIK